MKMRYSLLLLLSLWLLAGPTLAQTTDPVRQKLENIFATTDKSQLGRLLEAAEPSHYHK